MQFESFSFFTLLQVIRREGIPDTIQYGKLLKELQKEVKHFQVRKSGVLFQESPAVRLLLSPVHTRKFVKVLLRVVTLQKKKKKQTNKKENVVVCFQMPKGLKLNLKTEKEKEKDPKKEQKKRKKKTQLSAKDKANVDALHAYTQKELEMREWDAAKLASLAPRSTGQVSVGSPTQHSRYPQVTTTSIGIRQLQQQMASPTKLMTSPLASPVMTSREGSMLSTSVSSLHDSSFEEKHSAFSTGDGPEVSPAYCVPTF